MAIRINVIANTFVLMASISVIDSTNSGGIFCNVTSYSQRNRVAMLPKSELIAGVIVAVVSCGFMVCLCSGSRLVEGVVGVGHEV